MRLLKTLSEKEKFSAVEQSVIKYILDNPKDIVKLICRYESLPIRHLHRQRRFFVFAKNAG